MYDAAIPIDSGVLGARPATEPGVSIHETAGRGLVNLRGRADDDGFLEQVTAALGLELPTRPNTVSTNEAVHLLWLGPDEWLLVTDIEAQADIEARLADQLAGHFAAVTDVTGYYTLLTITGRDAPELLARGCPLDLHPRVFAAGACAQTLVAKAGVILQSIDDARHWRVFVRRSFADYLWTWLHDAARCLD